MRKGQLEHLLPELIIAVVAIFLGYFLIAIAGTPAHVEGLQTIKANNFAHHFDDYFITFLATPLPDSSAFPGYQQSVYAPIDGKGYTAGDLLFQALEDETKREDYLETFRHYFYISYGAVNVPQRITLRFTFPDGTVIHMGDLVQWRDKPPRTSYTLPYKEGKTLLIEATGWLV